MGQAKRRGTLDERIAQAKERRTAEHEAWVAGEAEREAYQRAHPRGRRSGSLSALLMAGRR